MTTRRWQWGAIVVVMFAAGVLFLYGLGAAPLQDYDEATYAQVTREMLASGNWLSLTRAGNNYFEKPPLFFWMIGISETTLGNSEFALRLPSALCGAALVAVVMLLTYELSKKNKWAVALAGAIVLTMSPVVEVARQVRIDVPVALWITLAAYAFVKGLQNPKYFLLFWFAAALAAMTKDVIAFFAFTAALAFALWFADFKWLKEKYFWWGIVLFLIVVLPWHIYETMQFGATFWREYIGFDVIQRSATDVFAVQNTNASYVWFLANMAAPWTQSFVFLLAALAVYWRHYAPAVRKSAAACASIVAVILAVFFVAKTKAPTYLLPLYPFAAVFIALVAQEVASNAVAGALQRAGAKPEQISSKKFVYPETALLATFTMVALSLGLASTMYNGFHFNPYFWQADELAREEKIVGSLMHPNAANAFYVFNDTDLGSVMYYSGNTKPRALTARAEPGSFILLPTQTGGSVEELYPNLKTKILYSGAQITLEQAE